MPGHGAFPHFVIGRITAVADAGQANTLFSGMRKRGHWANLPASSRRFWQQLQPVVIKTKRGTTFVTLTSQVEMNAAQFHVGDFVRYSPHRGKFENPPTDSVAAAYWRVDGCVAILCRAGDAACVKRYVSGVYRTSDGRQLEPGSFEPLPGGVVIDTGTMVPKRASGRAH